MRTSLFIFLTPMLFFCSPFFSQSFADDAEPQLVQLQEYKPIYLLMGTPDTKVQVSFKGQIVRQVPFYFAYSQLMMWDLFKSQSPVTDVDFNPEVFYRLYPDSNPDHWIDLGLFEHESNGHGGTTLERSWDRVSLSYHSRIVMGEKTRLLGSIKAWYPFAFNENSTDLAQYRGVWELQLTLVDFLGPFFDVDELSLRLYPGGTSFTNPLQGGQELTFKTKAKYRAFLPMFIIQFFHGYGEDLLDYNVNRVALRAGIGF